MKDLKIYLIIASVLFGLYLMAQLNRPKVTDWTVNLHNDDKIPFGTFIMYNRINDVFPGAKIIPYREPVYNVINDRKLRNSTYIIIAERVNLSKEDYDKLMQYIKNGNEVFIAANSFGQVLKKELKIETAYDSKSDDDVRIGFVSSSVNTKKFAADHDCTNGIFNDFDTVKATVLGQNEFKHSNYIKFNIGKGALYLNTCPLMFSNYTLLQDQSQEYAPTALSFLKSNSSVAWDEYYTQGRPGEESAMRVFLQHPPLRNALYIAFFSLLIFVFYEKKRRQRVIPIIAPLTNTSVEFVNVVGQVYYEQRNNSNIAQKKVAYFLEYLRSKYNLKTNLLDAEFQVTLANKSGVSQSLIHELINQMIGVRNGLPVNDRELIDLNKNIEQFYIQSR